MFPPVSTPSPLFLPLVLSVTHMHTFPPIHTLIFVSFKSYHLLPYSCPLCISCAGGRVCLFCMQSTAVPVVLFSSCSFSLSFPGSSVSVSSRPFAHSLFLLLPIPPSFFSYFSLFPFSLLPLWFLLLLPTLLTFDLEQPRAPSPDTIEEFPLNIKQAYKAFAAVPHSLAVLEPPQVG